jgi:hypothetical protein
MSEIKSMPTKLECSASIDKIVPAFVQAQGQLKKAAKTSENPHFRSSYADLESCWDACHESLQSNGLAVAQFPLKSEPGFIAVLTMLIHTSGQWWSSELVIPVPKFDAQGIGSAITYARRYVLCAMLGLVPQDTDDDGNKASERPKGKPQSRPAPSPPASPITPEQVEVVKKAGDANGTDFDKVRKYYKIPYVKDLPAALYDDCMKRVKAGEFKKNAVHANGDEHYQGPGTQP